MTDPSVGMNVRIIAFNICGANAASFNSCAANRAEGRRVIVAVFHERQVCDERELYAEARQGFDEASQPLRRRIQNPIHTHRVVETIAEDSVFLRVGPIRNRPSIVTPPDAKKRPWRAASIQDSFLFATIRRPGKLARLP